MRPNPRLLASLAVVSLVACSPTAGDESESMSLMPHQGTLSGVRLLIGDVDGFGIHPTTGLVRATPAPHNHPADVDGDGMIEPGEFLPDWNRNGSTAVGSGDDFDFRSADERAATNGAQWTDHSITPAGASDGATFTFRFTAPVPGDIDYGVDHFINFVFGDYDVVPASIKVDGQVMPLTKQPGNEDGLVQSAYAVVPWAAMTDGRVVITVIAPNEPYLAFDYALLDTDQIADCDGDGIPDTLDNCPCVANADQADLDHDGIGDACDPGCHVDADCSDGNACTADVCDGVAGTCSHPAVSCDDGNACTTDSCNPATGCAHGAISCDDGNACTTDSCDPATGCAHGAISCDDANACTTDSCNPATGCAHDAISCDDGNACTADSCDPAAGCQSVNQCPDCSAAAATVPTLWPPNHKLVAVGVQGVTDPQGQTTEVRIDGIAQDEPTDDLGDGRTCPDAEGVGSSTAQLRAERSGLGDGRVYHLAFTATDPDGYSCSGVVTSCVPHDQGGHACVDEGPRYDSLVCAQ